MVKILFFFTLVVVRRALIAATLHSTGILQVVITRQRNSRLWHHKSFRGAAPHLCKEHLRFNFWFY